MLKVHFHAECRNLHLLFNVKAWEWKNLIAQSQIQLVPWLRDVEVSLNKALSNWPRSPLHSFCNRNTLQPDYFSTWEIQLWMGVSRFFGCIMWNSEKWGAIVKYHINHLKDDSHFVHATSTMAFNEMLIFGRKKFNLYWGNNMNIMKLPSLCQIEFHTWTTTWILRIRFFSFLPSCLDNRSSWKRNLRLKFINLIGLFFRKHIENRPEERTWGSVLDQILEAFSW